MGTGVSSNAVICTYTWGMDLSGSMKGAGGVGGLLFTNIAALSSPFHAPSYDGNGNIIAYVEMATGTKSATYEYNAFGETIIADGAARDAFTCRFSTKYTDNETSLLYYGLRYYSPSTGKWLNRDLIEESGGLNLSAFLGNDPLQRIDPWGLKESRHVPGGTLEWNLRRRRDSGQPLKFEITFSPDSKTCACKHISFIQVVIQNTTGGEARYPGDADDYLPISGGFGGGLRVDRLPSDKDPFYSAKRDPILSGWVGARPGWTVGNGPSGRPAIATDAPGANDARMGHGDRRLRFETFAVCIDTGVIYGGVRWGMDIEDKPGSVPQFTGGTASDFLSKPSTAWRLGVDKWNESAPDKGWETFNTWAVP